MYFYVADDSPFRDSFHSIVQAAVITMKVLEHDRKRGTMKVVSQNIDDLWTLYNVIRKGDLIYARTSREVKAEEEVIRPTKGKRVAMSLGLRVEYVSLHRYSEKLRAHGIIIEAPDEFGLLGSHHTIEIALDKPVTICKEEWLSYDIERIERASQEEVSPIIVVSIDDENGCVALLHQHGIEAKAEIAARLPGKREADKREAALARYFDSVMKELVRVWEEGHGLIAVIGPGFLKEVFAKYVRERRQDIFKDVSAVMTVGNGGVAGVNEAVRSGVLDAVAKKTRMIEETRVVGEFLSRLASRRGDITYGVEEVRKATGYGAVKLLLVSDALLREADDEDRRGMDSIMRDVEKARGKVMIVSAEHEAGQELLSLGGMAALLRFRVDSSSEQ